LFSFLSKENKSKNKLCDLRGSAVRIVLTIMKLCILKYIPIKAGYMPKKRENDIRKGYGRRMWFFQLENTDKFIY